MQARITFESIAGSTFSSGILCGVAVITEGEAKGHGVFIDGKTLLSVKECANTHTDGVQVKSNHGTGFDSIVGVLKNFRIKGPKLLADLHLLKSHDDYNRIIEIAETMPASVGLSISFSGDKEEIDGREYARCTELYSVDFVDRPAANPSGLFSQAVDSFPRVMTFENFFSKFRGAIVETENTELVSVKTELSCANEKAKELSLKVATFESELKAANEKASKLELDFKALEESIPAKIEVEASKKAQAIMASLGQPPVHSVPSGNPANSNKSEISNLKGREKVVAAFKAQTEKNSTK